ncbi:MAG: hypothetical protein HQK89_02185 [Nitrospirae bacterium]|nr:hypothetical protein [Nitrospirota bacterium]
MTLLMKRALRLKLTKDHEIILNPGDTYNPERADVERALLEKGYAIPVKPADNVEPVEPPATAVKETIELKPGTFAFEVMSKTLGCSIWVVPEVKDKAALRVRGKATEAVIYTIDEVRALKAAGVDGDLLKSIHEIKASLGGELLDVSKAKQAIEAKA